MTLEAIPVLRFAQQTIGKLWRAFRKQQEEKHSLAKRFIDLFEDHGISRNQIPGFMGYELRVADVKNYEVLLPKLSEELLNAVSTKFSIRREWLDGADSQIYPTHDFYKYPENFVAFIEELSKRNPESDLCGRLLIPAELDDRAPALIILQETIGLIGAKAIYR